MEEDEIKTLIEDSEKVLHRAPCVVHVGSTVYKVKQVSNTVRTRISLLEKESYLLEEEGKLGVPLKRAKKIDRKLRTLHSKTAAYYLLNNKAIFIPFLFAIKWRMLDLRDSEHTYRINEAGMNNQGLDFFLANWQITKAQLVLSTRLVGEGLKDYTERMETVQDMLEKDASGVKRENK